VWILISWHGLMNLAGVDQQQKPEKIVEFNSSEIQIRPPTRTAVPIQHKAPPPTAPKPQPQRAQQQAVVPRPRTQPTEIARIVPNATPQPRSAERTKAAALAEQLAQQEVAFAREAAQLNNSHSPTDVATADPRLHDQQNNDFHSAFAGSRELQGKGDGFLEPLQRWRGSGATAGQNCYYGRYYWTYPTGGQEVANIPWAFCYFPASDPIAHGIREFPFPDPLPGYRLPAGTPMQPIEKDVYEYWLAHQ
jgi:hypothetical protein